MKKETKNKKQNKQPKGQQTVSEKETKKNEKLNQEEKKEQNKLAELQEELQNEKDKYLRLYAEFENFRKRTAKERLELYETAGEGILKNLLPILDDFERAMNEMEKNGENEMLKGVALIYNKFFKTLEKEGLKRIEVKKGDDFNPEIHEAIAQIPVEEDDLKQKIVDVVEKGYQLGNKIIRFPKVVTGK